MTGDREVAGALHAVAHAIRRAAAAQVAVSLTDPGSTMDDWERTADRVAAWIRGAAGAEHERRQQAQTPIGQSWQDTISDSPG